MEYTQEYRLAIQAAIDASLAIKEIYSREFKSVLKSDGSPVTEADLKASEIINRVLSFSNLPVIDEESDKLPYGKRKHWEKCWCVDPLDGTKEFLKRNDQFAVNIALIEKRRAVLGVIASPVLEEFIVGGPNIGAHYSRFNSFLNGNAPVSIQQSIAPNELSVIASNSHHSPLLKKYLNLLSKSGYETKLIRKGSALKFFDLAMNNCQVYPRFAPTMEWDIAAGQAILEGIGGGVFEIHSKLPLSYNKEILINPHFIAVSDVNLSLWR